MRRSKRMLLLLGAVLAACAVTFAVSCYETRQEQIATTDEVILSLSQDTVQSLSWTYDGQSLSFHQEDGWVYDEDQAFPVDQEKIAQLLEPFQSLGASFVIDDVEDYGQYGLEDPLCTISLATEEETYQILLGDYSTMDQERYVSIGDGNAYLVQEDPLEVFDLTLDDLMEQDQVPAFDLISQIQFSGAVDSQIIYQLGSDDTYREADAYFLQSGEDRLPLDTNQVEAYLQALESLDLTNDVTYKATEEDLETYGLDDPELTVSVDYTWEDEDSQDHSETFTLQVSRDPEEAAQEPEVQTEETETGEDTQAEITAYARVGDSPIIYQIAGGEYEALLAASYDDLRHTEILPAEFQNVAQVDIVLDEASYTITSQGEGEDRTFSYQEEELDITTFQSALESLTAQEFTQQAATEPQEISLTVHLDLEGEPTVQIDLYRYDGSTCLAVVGGTSVALVPREQVVDLVEAVHAIVWN